MIDQEILPFEITESFFSVNLVNAFAQHFGASKSSVRRDINHGGLKICDVDPDTGSVRKTPYPYYTCAYGDVKNKVVQLGKRRFLKIRLTAQG